MQRFRMGGIRGCWREKARPRQKGWWASAAQVEKLMGHIAPCASSPADRLSCRLAPAAHQSSTILFSPLPQRWQEGRWWWLSGANQTAYAGTDLRQTCRRSRALGLVS